MRSLRRQLTLRLVLALAALLLLGGATLGVVVHAQLVREFDAGLVARARALATLVEIETDGLYEFEFDDQAAPEFGTVTVLDHFQIWEPDGTELARSESLGEESLTSAGGEPSEQVFWNLDLPDGQSGRAVQIRFTPHGEGLTEADKARNDQATLVYARSRGDLNRSLQMLWGVVALASLLLPLGASLIVWTAVRRTLRPLDRVAAEASGIDAEHLSHRFDVGNLPEELQPVCARLNESLGRLEEAFARERRFTSAVAHELRTPLAEIRSATEVALRWQEDAELSRHGLETGLDVAVQMERLVSSLLSLTRHEAGHLALESESVELTATLKEVWQPLKERAAAKSLQVSLDVPSSATVKTDRTLIRAILSNLANNAIEHSPSGGEIAWQVEETDSGTMITVTNTAPDLRPEDIPRLAEPFWRRDAARTNGQHSGLGLTLAASFAEALGGSLDFTMLDPPALQARVTLPRSV